MNSRPPAFHTEHRLTGVAATIAVHIALVAGWLLAREVEVDIDNAPRSSIQWVDIKPDAPPRPAPSPPQAEPVARSKPPTPVTAVATPAQPPAQAAQAPAAEPVAPATAAKSAYDMMQQARGDIGKIDKDLKALFPERTIRAPIDSPQKRLEKGIELAHELAPPKWYQPAKVKEVTDPGQYGRKRYRVTTALGTYCMTYESNHSPDGRDPMTRNTAPKMTNCDTDLPATKQEWSTK